MRFCGIDVSARPDNQQLCTLHERKGTEGIELVATFYAPGTVEHVARTIQGFGRGEAGQIEVKGNLTPGYDGASAQNNAKAFTADGYFRTGDQGMLTAEGDIMFLARTTEMIKRSGINIAPAEVEEVLRHHPDVAEVGVIGAPHPEKGEMVLAFVVAKPGAKLTEDILRAHCRAEAASYKTPDRIEICDRLPTTATGKLMRAELKNMAAHLAPRAR